MRIVSIRCMYCKIRTIFKTSQDSFSIFSTFARPFRHLFQLDTTDYRLHFHHAPVGTKGIMQPAETRRMLFIINTVKVLAMVFIGPHFFPQLFIIGGDHTAFTPYGHDLVLTERPGTYMSN